jgi:hypothetical protein
MPCPGYTEVKLLPKTAGSGCGAQTKEIEYFAPGIIAIGTAGGAEYPQL